MFCAPKLMNAYRIGRHSYSAELSTIRELQLVTMSNSKLRAEHLGPGRSVADDEAGLDGPAKLAALDRGLLAGPGCKIYRDDAASVGLVALDGAGTRPSPRR
jgi:hypothetical protein